MARARNIKPKFFQNDALAELHPLERLAFIGMWCHADNDGRLEDRPNELKAEILPHDDCDVTEMLARLERAGFILLCVHENVNYIQIVNFGQWCFTKTPEIVNAEGAARRARKINALPKWSDKPAIKEIYKFAKSISASSGNAHHVDHEIPLKGKNVCGLHVEANLRVIPAKDNLKKANKFEVNHG